MTGLSRLLCSFCLPLLCANSAAWAQYDPSAVEQEATTETDTTEGASKPSEADAVKELSDFEEVSLEDLLNTEVTVASKTKEVVTSAPSSVTVFTQQEIHSMGITDLEELLNFVPGLQATREVEQGRSVRIGARGRSTGVTESILFLINGQRINGIYTGGIAVINRLIAVQNIKRVEIIRGPGSALYGSNAFVGVVNIITADDTTDLSFDVGNLNSLSMAANLSHKFFDGDLSVSGFFRAFSDEGQEYKGIAGVFGIPGDTKDPRHGFDVNLTLKYKGLSLFARHVERYFDDFMTFSTLQPLRENAHESTKQTAVKLDFSVNPIEDLQLDFSVGYSRERWKTLAILVPKGIELAPDFILEQTMFGGPYMDSYSMHAGIGGTYNIIESNQLMVGASYEQGGITEVFDMRTHHPATLEYFGEIHENRGPHGAFNEEKTRHSIGIFLEDQQKLGDWVSITAGVRYDYYDDFGSAFSPRATAVVSTPINSKVKLIYGMAFRAPSFLELYDKNNPVDFGNPDLDAEKIQTFEIAYVQTIQNFLQATVTYYYSIITDMIVFGAPAPPSEFNPMEAPTFDNSGEDLLRGFEFDFKASPIRNMLIIGTFTHLIEADKLVMPSNFGSLAISYRLWDIRLTITGLLRQKIKQLPQQDTYFLLNANAEYYVSKRLSLRFNIKNLLDTNYYTITSIPDLAVPNRGMTFMAGITCSL